jgi:hypothetical protein
MQGPHSRIVLNQSWVTAAGRARPLINAALAFGSAELTRSRGCVNENV